MDSVRLPPSSSPLSPGSSAIRRRQTGQEAAEPPPPGSFLPQIEHLRVADGGIADGGIDAVVSVSARFFFFLAEFIAPNNPPRRPAPRRADEFHHQWQRAPKPCVRPRGEEQSNTAGATGGSACL